MEKTNKSAYRLRIQITKTLKIVWVLFSLAVLVVTLSCYRPDTSSDIAIFLVYGMLILTFPVSYLVAIVFGLLALIREQSGMFLLDLIGSGYIGFSVM